MSNEPTISKGLQNLIDGYQQQITTLESVYKDALALCTHYEARISELYAQLEAAQNPDNTLRAYSLGRADAETERQPAERKEARASEAPRRAYVLTLEIGADSRNELCAALRQLEFEVHAEQLTSGVSGGYGSGYTYNLDVDESITHDSYMAAINAWLAERKEENNATD